MLPADLARSSRAPRATRCTLIELAPGLAAGDDALGIEQLVGERIDALTEADRGDAAARGGARRPDPARPVHEVRRDAAALGRLVAFLELGVDAVSFRSELFRDVAYDQLTFQARRELHRAAAAAIAADPRWVGLARRDARRALRSRRGLGAALRAAARAAAAAEQALRARRGGARVPHRRRGGAALGRVGRRLADAARVARPRERGRRLGGGGARGVLERPQADRRCRRPRAARPQARVRPQHPRPARRGGARPARRRAGRSAAAGEAGTGVLAAIAVTEAGLRLRQARWADARGLAHEAIALLDGDATTDDTAKRVLADAYRYHDIAASELEGDAAMVHLPRALELYDEAGDELSKSKVLSLLGVRAYYRGEWTMAAALYEQARIAARGCRRRRRRRDRGGERRRGPHRPGPHRRGATAHRRRAARLRGIRQSLSRRVRHGLRRARSRSRRAIPRRARSGLPRGRGRIRGSRRDGCRARRARAAARGDARRAATSTRRAELAERARAPRRRPAPRCASAHGSRLSRRRCREAASP